MHDPREINSKAEKLFLKYGIKSVSMDDICRELGISKKTLYNHFSNKNALVESVIKNHVSEERKQIDQLIENAQDALDELNKISSLVLTTVEEVSPSTLYDLQKYYRKSWDILMKEQNEYIFQCFYKNLLRGIEEGLFRKDLNPVIVARIYSNTSYFVVEVLSDPTSSITRKEMIEELYNYHVQGIATAKGLRRWKKYRMKQLNTKMIA